MAELLQRPIASVLLALACTSCAPGSEPARPPNLLFITLDTLRADRAGYIGNQDGLTPNLDALAAAEVLPPSPVAPSLKGSPETF